MEINPIGHIRTDFKEKFGIPRQSGRVSELRGTVVFCEEFRDCEILRGIEDFSHLWIIFGFSKAEYKKGTNTVRPPRLGGNKRVGIFASRSPYRPNSLGLSVVKLEKVRKTISDGTVLDVLGVDMLDGTPIYDIKPYIPYADSIPHAVGGYADGLAAYSIEVDFPKTLLEKVPKDKREALVKCLREDPRPTYQAEERIYHMSFAEFDVEFVVKNQVLKVVNVKNNQDFL